MDIVKMAKTERTVRNRVLTINWEKKYGGDTLDKKIENQIVRTIEKNWPKIEELAGKEYNHHLYEMFGDTDKPNKRDEKRFISMLEPVNCMVYFLHKNRNYDGFSLDLAGENLTKELDNRKLEMEFNGDGDLENDYFVVR